MRPVITPLVFVLLSSIALSPRALAVDTRSVDHDSGRATLGTYEMCGAELAVTDLARLTTGFSADPTWAFNITTGLWVGARVDRGAGPETHVSTGYFSGEFYPVDDPPLRTPREEFLPHGHVAVMRDVFTPDWLPDHTPLGIEVLQESHVVNSFGDLSWVDVNYTITNISSELSEGGWDLENVYLGLLADPDVGFDSGLDFWADDLGGFQAGASVPGGSVSGASRGDLAYLYDEAGSGDDTNVQVGLVLRGAKAHRFAIWSGGAQDPSNDTARYAFMRGVSDEVPTIDPSPARSNDYRILLGVGPIASLAPGASTSFAVSIVCGDLVQKSTLPEPIRTESTLPDLVVPAGTSTVPLHAESPMHVWSVTGRRVATVLPGGAWDLRMSGALAPAGVYFYGPADRTAPAGRLVLLR